MTSFSKSANACGVQSEGEKTDEISIPVAELLRLVIKCQTNFQDYFMTGGMRCSRRIGLPKRLARYLRLRQISVTSSSGIITCGSGPAFHLTGVNTARGASSNLLRSTDLYRAKEDARSFGELPFQLSNEAPAVI